MPPTPSATGRTPAMPNKKEERSEGSCASRTTASTTERKMSWTNALTSETDAPLVMPNKKE